MNRFMVVMGFGSLLLPLSSHLPSVCAEMPRYNSSSSSSSSSTVEPPVVWHDTLQAGWAESRRRNVPMVIYITSDNCQYCVAMKRDTWCDPSIRQRLSQGFVAIRLTPRRNSATLNRIDVKMYPATLVGVPQGKIIGHRFGYQPPNEMHQVLNRAKDRPLRHR